MPFNRSAPIYEASAQALAAVPIHLMWPSSMAHSLSSYLAHNLFGEPTDVGARLQMGCNPQAQFMRPCHETERRDDVAALDFIPH